MATLLHVFFLLTVLSTSNVATMDSRTFWACVQDPSLAYCPDTPIKDPRIAKTTTTTPAPPVVETTPAVSLAPNDFLLPKAPIDKAQAEREQQECITLQTEYKSVCSRKPPKGAELETITFCNMYKQQCLVKRPVT
uniref:Secreted protein n=1 Tax=Steinernema glaseri TaxID=37863 RepID=A0A1I7Y2J0_9BILA